MGVRAAASTKSSPTASAWMCAIEKVRQHEIKYLESGPLHKRVDPRAEKEREYLKAAADAANARHALRDQLSVNTWVAPPNPNNDMKALKLHMQLLKDHKPPVSAIFIPAPPVCAIFPAPPPALALDMCTEEWIPPRPAKTKKKKKGLPGRATVAE